MSTAIASGPFARVLETSAGSPAPELLQQLRGRGREQFERAGLPSRRREAWRFTRLKDIEQAVYEPPATSPERVDISRWQRQECHTLVFVDGLFSPDLSAKPKLPDGVTISNLVLSSVSESAVASEHLGRLIDLNDHPFAALNSAILTDGAVIHLPEGATVEQPIQLLFVAGTGDQPTVRAPRILVVAEPGSRATLEEHHVGSDNASLTCPVSEITLARDATLEHVVIQQEGTETSFLATRTVQLAAGSRYLSHNLSLGGGLARNDIDVRLGGEHAEAALDGLYLTDGRQHADTHLTVRHHAGRCESHQLYKGILGGRSRAVFNGRIVVDQDAQQTDANQSNRNLLLSDDAVVNSNPQLEIFADDVRCTHGSTVGRLDDEAIFYLRTRGIDRAAAQRLLTTAFAGEVLDRVPVDDLRDRLRIDVEARLDDMTEGRSAA
jgi:Fe-S cluster assembly protein SufD